MRVCTELPSQMPPGRPRVKVGLFICLPHSQAYGLEVYLLEHIRLESRPVEDARMSRMVKVQLSLVRLAWIEQCKMCASKFDTCSQRSTRCA